MNTDKLKRIEEKKKLGYSRNNRRLKSYSENFKLMFIFFLRSYRSGILTFCGTDVKTNINSSSGDAMYSFREYDNGRYKGVVSIPTKHPNILKGIIIAKKAWGLWSKEWSQGIVEGSFTKKEILDNFNERNIIIPESLLLEFENKIDKEIKTVIENNYKNNTNKKEIYTLAKEYIDDVDDFWIRRLK